MRPAGLSCFHRIALVAVRTATRQVDCAPDPAVIAETALVEKDCYCRHGKILPPPSRLVKHIPPGGWQSSGYKSCLYCNGWAIAPAPTPGSAAASSPPASGIAVAPPIPPCRPAHTVSRRSSIPRYLPGRSHAPATACPKDSGDS